MHAEHKVTGIRSRRGSKRREIELDCDSWLCVPNAVLVQLAIDTGDLIDPDEITARIAQLEPPAARERAIRLLAYRDRSEAEMRTRLLDDGYTQETVDHTVGWLLETGLLDDDRFTEQLVRSLVVGRRQGRTKSLQRLRRSGVSDDVALRALDAAAPPEDERDRARDLAGRLFRSGDTIERLAARLMRRGYAPADAIAASREQVGEMESFEQPRSDET